MIWIKALHIIAVVCWFAGLLYLPRLFAYHAMAEDAISRERFKLMERKLYRVIMTPASLAVFILGMIMLVDRWDYFKQTPWMHIKLSLVFLLYGYHGFCGKLLRQFATDTNTRSHTFYRWFNEFPALILIAVVILAVTKMPA